MRVLGFAIESERKRMDLHGEASGELVFVATVRGRHNRWRVGGAPNEVCAVKESSREVEVAVAEEYIGDVSCEADGVLDVEISLGPETAFSRPEQCDSKVTYPASSGSCGLVPSSTNCVVKVVEGSMSGRN